MLLRSGHELRPLRRPQALPPERGSAPARRCLSEKSSGHCPESAPAETRSRPYAGGNKLPPPVHTREACAGVPVERTGLKDDLSEPVSRQWSNVILEPFWH